MSKCNCNNSNNYVSPYNQKNYQYSQDPFPTNFLYGHAYTPTGQMQNTFTPENGLQNGSLFPELVSSYSPGDSINFINYLKTDNGSGGCGCGR